MGRFGEAAEMAKAAWFLASSESSYVTGTDFLVSSAGDFKTEIQHTHIHA